MHVSKSTTSIVVPTPLAANLGEIGRHVADCVDGEIDDPRNAALRVFVTDYVDQYSDQFRQKDDDLYIYDGGDYGDD